MAPRDQDFGLEDITALQGDFCIRPVWPEIAHSRPFWGVFGRYYPQMNSNIVATPKRTVLGRKHVVWAINRGNPSTGSTWAHAWEKLQYNQLTRKKSQNRNIISPIWGEAPTEWIEMKICTGVELLDIIMDAKFKFEKFKGFWCHWGSKFALSH